MNNNSYFEKLFWVIGFCSFSLNCNGTKEPVISLPAVKNNPDYNFKELIERINRVAEYSFGINPVTKKSNLNYKNWDLSKSDYRENRWEILLNEVNDFVTNFKYSTRISLLKCITATDNQKIALCSKKFIDRKIPTLFELSRATFRLLNNLSARFVKNDTDFYKYFIQVIYNHDTGLLTLIDRLKKIALEYASQSLPVNEKKQIWFQDHSESQKIILKVIDIYEAVLHKIISDFSPSKQELKADIDKLANQIFLDKNIDLKNNLSAVAKQKWAALADKINLFMINSGSRDFPQIYRDSLRSFIFIDLINVINQPHEKHQDFDQILDRFVTLKKQEADKLKWKFAVMPRKAEAKEILAYLLSKVDLITQKLIKDWERGLTE